MTETKTHKIYIVVTNDGEHRVDEKTLPDNVEIVIFNLDVLVDQPEEFVQLTDDDQSYLSTEYPEITDSIREAAGLLAYDPAGDDEEEEVSEGEPFENEEFDPHESK
jgi:hypothetical protein